jgi:hypothetical protein
MSNCATTTPTAGSYAVTCYPSSPIVGIGGGSAATRCTAQSTGGYASPVSLACVGATCSITPSSATLTPNGSAAFVVRTTVPPLPPGAYPFQVRGAPTANQVSIHSATVSPTVLPPAVGAIATFDATRQAPRCGPSHTCDSGSLLNGGGNSELDQPNTIRASCADGVGPEGTVERVRVRSADGQQLAAGRSVFIEATVDTRFVLDDMVDFYHAPDADNPQWTLIGSVDPVDRELQDFSVPFVLPAGGLQAVRVQYRSGRSWTVVPCTTNGADERDDLIFAVGS